MDVFTAVRTDGFDTANTDLPLPEEAHCCRLETSILRSSCKAPITAAVVTLTVFATAARVPMT